MPPRTVDGQASPFGPHACPHARGAPFGVRRGAAALRGLTGFRPWVVTLTGREQMHAPL